MPGEAEAGVEEELGPECPECHEHGESICSRCDQCRGCCECEHCSGCSEPTESICEGCSQCESCCSCQHCDRCHEPVESTCDHCDRCDNCCDCLHCASCGSAVDSTCERCNDCPDCCECDHCSNCCDPVDSTCSRCGRCNDCCNCSSNSAKFCDRSIKFIDGTDFTANPSKRYIAAELEFAGCEGFDHIDDACRQWSVSVVSDGSLPDEGFELNTSPASGNKWAKMIESVCDALDGDDAKVNRDCGYHVHIDARDYDFAALQRLIEVYALIEDALFSVVTKSRRNNEYCIRCGQRFLECSQLGIDPEDKTAKATYGKSANRDTLQHQKAHKYPDGCGRVRYSALNLHSWNFRGTLECRLHHGTKSPKNIVNWGILWAAIIDFAKSRSAAELPNQGWEALLEIAPTEDVRQWLTERQIRFSS